MTPRLVVYLSTCRYGFLDGASKIVGYARSSLSRETFITRLRPFLEQKFDSTTVEEEDGERNRLIDEFFRMCEYVQGSYDAEGCFEGYRKVSQLLDCHEQSGAQVLPPLRVFYLALPPSVFISASKGIKAILVKDQVICRVIVEKPFGRDLDSSNLLSASLSELFLESQVILHRTLSYDIYMVFRFTEWIIIWEKKWSRIFLL